MSPSLQTMGFFMSDINFCNTKEQLTHLGEVVTGRVDGSPTGADIDTSTLPYTGQVRRTLPALEGEYEQSITDKEAEADAAIDSYRLLNKGPYASGITLESKFEYITYNGESYFALNPPYTTTATTPDSDGNLFVGGYIPQASLSDYTDIVYKALGGNSAVDNMLSDFNFNPLMYAVGSVIKTGGTSWEYIDSTGPITIDNFRAFNVVNVFDFGAKQDLNFDSGPALQAAFNTKRRVYIPGGEYASSQTLHPHAQQTIEGEGGTQRGAIQSESCTSIVFDEGVNGFDTTVNIALGCKLLNIAARARDQVTGNGSVGFKIGEKGTAGGSSQSLKIELSDLYASGFDISYGIYGWAWEITGHRCFSDKARSIGFDFDDAPTVTSFTDCTVLAAGVAFASSPANLSAKGFVFSGDSQVYLHSPRVENVQGDGYTLNGTAKVTIDSIYNEGNRVNDITLSNDFSGSLIVNGGRFVHDNSGVNTFSCVKNTSNQKCYVKITGVEYKLGITNDNTTTSGFYYSESNVPMVIIEGLIISGDISKMSGSNKEVVYLSQSGRYAPTEFTVSDLPNVRFYQDGNSHVAKVVGNLPTSLLISDGVSSYDMLKNNSIGDIEGRTYRWVSDKSAWALITMRDFASVDLKNSSDSPSRWWGDFGGIEVVRFTGGPSSTIVTIDTTGAEEGSDFYVKTYSEQVTPSTLTINDELGSELAVITPEAGSGVGGIIATFSYFTKVGVGTGFQLKHILRGEV